jgi:hypothetical protein
MKTNLAVDMPLSVAVHDLIFVKALFIFEIDVEPVMSYGNV